MSVGGGGVRGFQPSLHFFETAPNRTSNTNTSKTVKVPPCPWAGAAPLWTWARPKHLPLLYCTIHRTSGQCSLPLNSSQNPSRNGKKISTSAWENAKKVLSGSQQPAQTDNIITYTVQYNHTITMASLNEPVKALGGRFRTSVVHCKSGLPFDVYVGRPSAGAPAGAEAKVDIGWGNPFRMRSKGISDRERRRVINRYREYLMANPVLVTKARAELKGKVLACWCSPKDCHAHVLAAVANTEGDEFPPEVFFPEKNAPSSAAVLAADDEHPQDHPSAVVSHAKVSPSAVPKVIESIVPQPAHRGRHRTAWSSAPLGNPGSQVASVIPAAACAASAASSDIPLVPSGSPSGVVDAVGAMLILPPRSLIDIGVNLTSKAFKKDVFGVVERAARAGVSPLIVTGTSVAESLSAQRLCHLYQQQRQQQQQVTGSVSGSGDGGGGPGLVFTAGVHPHHAGGWLGGGGAKARLDLEALEGLLADPLCVASGECGLDFNRNYAPRADQVSCDPSTSNFSHVNTYARTQTAASLFFTSSSQLNFPFLLCRRSVLSTSCAFRIKQANRYFFMSATHRTGSPPCSMRWRAAAAVMVASKWTIRALQSRRRRRRHSAGWCTASRGASTPRKATSPAACTSAWPARCACRSAVQAFAPPCSPPCRWTA